MQQIGAIKKAEPKQPPYPQARNGDNSKNTPSTRVMLLDTDCVGCGQCLHGCNFGAI